MPGVVVHRSPAGKLIDPLATAAKAAEINARAAGFAGLAAFFQAVGLILAALGWQHIARPS